MAAKYRRIPIEIRKAYQSLQDSADSLHTQLEKLEEDREERLKSILLELDNEKEILLKQLNKIERAMHILYPKRVDDYDKEAGWKDKIIWVLKNTNRLLPVSSIVSKIKENEEDIDSSINPIVRLTLKRMNEKREVIKFENPNITGIHYGLPEWFINDKLIEESYL